MIIHSAKNYVFGGYTKAKVDISRGHSGQYYDHDAFIFLLRSQQRNEPNKWNIQKQQWRNAYWCDLDKGISFGNVDIQIQGNMKSGWTSLAVIPDYTAPKDDQLLAGESHFQVTDIEVFHVNQQK